jgi:hypothetical protein
MDVNAASLKDIGDFDVQKLRSIKLNERFKKRVKTFDHIGITALQQEMVAVLEKADANVNYGKFAKQTPLEAIPEPKGCCTVL